MGLAKGSREQQYVVEQVAFYGDIALTRAWPKSWNDARQGYVSESVQCRETSSSRTLLISLKLKGEEQDGEWGWPLVRRILVSGSSSLRLVEYVPYLPIERRPATDWRVGSVREHHGRYRGRQLHPKESLRPGTSTRDGRVLGQADGLHGAFANNVIWTKIRQECR